VSTSESVAQLRTARRWYLQVRRKRYEELWEMYQSPYTTNSPQGCAIHKIVTAQIDREENEDSSDG
jgi:hypothetical protein